MAGIARENRLRLVSKFGLKIGFIDAARIAGLLSGENRLRAILQLQVEGGDNSFEFGGGHFVEEGESNKAGAEIFGVAKSERADELLSEG